VLLDLRQNERFFPLDEYLQPGLALHAAGPFPLQGERLTRLA